MVSGTSYARSGRPSMPPSKLFELLLRIRESVGEVVFLDALALVQTESRSPEGWGGGGVGAGGDPDAGGGAGVGQSKC